MEIPGFTIEGAPRTKKTHSKIVQIPKAGSRRCPACGHRPGFPKLLPSDAHEAWHREAMAECLYIKAELVRAGVTLPISAAVNVRAFFYRQAMVGDACGFYQALGDLLQDVGIIVNDKQIASWDGTRLRKDAGRPRIEVWLDVVREVEVQEDLLAELRSGK